MQFQQIGDSLVLIKNLPFPAYLAAHLIPKDFPGILSLIPAYDCLGLQIDPLAYNHGLAQTQIEQALKSANPTSLPEPQHHVIPADYSGGEDLSEVCNQLKISESQFIALHSAQIYTVQAIGFCPGFPYLGPNPPQLSHLPRRSSPRPQVPPGSIAIAQDQTCIYPLPRPGGWHLIAKTNREIVSLDPPRTLLKPGDTVSFQPN